MEENKTTEQSQSPDFELCGACGAVLEKDAKFCNRCGVKLETHAEEKIDALASEAPEGEATTDEAPTDDAPVAETEKSEEAETPEQKNVCSVCGNELEDGAKFCNRCGARVQKPIEADAKRFCMNCGADVTGVKFCPRCGVPVGEVSTAGGAYVPASAPAPAAVQAQDKQTKNKRLAGAILYIIGACISVILGFAFMCTPFISISVRTYNYSDTCSQNGLTLIGAMFGAHSELVETGVNSTLLGWAGWLYFAFLLAIINHCVAFALNVSRYRKGERPYNIVQSNTAMFLVGVLVLIVGCIARWQIGNAFDEAGLQGYASLSSYLGFVGIFVITLIGFGCVLAGYICSNKTFPPRDRKAKKTGNVLIIFIVDLVCGVIIGVSAIAPLYGGLNYNHDKEIVVEVGDTGKAATDCDEYYMGYTVGATVFKLEDLEYGEDYIFRIETNDVGQYALVGSIALVYYDDVSYMDADEIFDILEDVYIDANGENETGEGYAYLYFNNSTHRDLAIVVGFMATGDMTVKYEYSLNEA